MFTAAQLVQLALATFPLLGMLVLAVDRMSSKKSITTRTVIKAMGLTVVPSIVILAMQGLLMNPVAGSFLGVLVGFVLANLVSSD